MLTDPVIPIVDADAGAQAAGWKRQLSEAVSDSAELLALLELDGGRLGVDGQQAFRLRVPRAYVAKMRKGDYQDPLLLQVLPRRIENAAQGLLDPVADLAAMPASGVLHKYHGRALLITTGACAVHCRYCFRRHFPYGGASSSEANMQGVLQYLGNDSSISEVVLSGGDPLVLDDERLALLIERIAGIDHVDNLRLHTRLPVVLPARITDSLCRLLGSSRLRTTMVIHANHANEIRQAECAALNQLQAAGITLLNQSVLLRGVNDNADALVALSQRLHACHVLPYYLHLLDPVQGAMHFDVNESDARRIVAEMRARLPGYLLPRLVREEPNSPSKTTISAI